MNNYLEILSVTCVAVSIIALSVEKVIDYLKKVPVTSKRRLIGAA